MQQTGLAGSKVALLAADGAEQIEQALRDAGATPVRLTRGSLADAKATDFCALVVAGGEELADERAVSLVRGFLDADKPVAATGRGASLLVAADAVKGRSLASDPAIRADIESAGGEWVDKEVVVDQKLITSRTADDLPAFSRRVVADFADWLDDDLVDRASEASFPASDPPPGPAAAGKAAE